MFVNFQILDNAKYRHLTFIIKTKIHILPHALYRNFDVCLFPEFARGKIHFLPNPLTRKFDFFQFPDFARRKI